VAQITNGKQRREQSDNHSLRSLLFPEFQYFKQHVARITNHNILLHSSKRRRQIQSDEIWQSEQDEDGEAIDHLARENEESDLANKRRKSSLLFGDSLEQPSSAQASLPFHYQFNDNIYEVCCSSEEQCQ
jgi:hypothetical protein